MEAEAEKNKIKQTQRSIQDFLIEKISKLSTHLTKDSVLALDRIDREFDSHTGSYALFNNMMFPAPHVALRGDMKAPGLRTTRTHVQYKFIYELHALGATDKEIKISPEQAQKLMLLFGTEAGFSQLPIDMMVPNAANIRVFPLCEILDAQQIKGYFGKTSAHLKSLWTKARAKANLPLDPDILPPVPPPPAAEEVEDIWCFCREPHNDRDMIQCEACEEWYHMDCVAYDEETSAVEYHCELCRDK